MIEIFRLSITYDTTTIAQMDSAKQMRSNAMASTTSLNRIVGCDRQRVELKKSYQAFEPKLSYDILQKQFHRLKTVAFV